MRVCFNAVAPIFLLMALGYAAQRAGAIRREDEVPRLNKLVFCTFMSVTMFYSLYASDISQVMHPKLLAFGVGGALAVYAASVGWVLLTERSPEKRGVKIQGMYRSNFLLLGLPLAASLVKGQDMGAVAALVAVVIPIYNVLAVITLEVCRGEQIRPGKLVLNVVKNPLIVGALAGLVFLVTPVRLPGVVETVVKQVSSLSSPLMLFLLGAFFRFDGLRRYWRDLLGVCLARLIVIPGAMLTAAYWLGFRGVDFAGLIGLFGSSTAVASFTMVQQMGGDSELAGDIVVSTSALCVVTLFLWSWLFRSLGAF